ncbi:MAG: sigma-70 family RNA polymerase sigma factor [Planctomycetes bacterium]|nr:sigma-70 family RNA polymerase sigma factor [Planctomycetota bacterium]
MLVTDIVRGSTDPEDAWQQVVEQYGPAILDWCRHAGLQPADADDVAQQVFLATIKGITNLRLDRPGDSFAGWLCTITRNKIRRRRRQLAAAPSSIGEHDPPDTDASTVIRELHEILVASLVATARSLSLPCFRRKNAIAKCIALVLWYLRKILHSIDDLVNELVRRLPPETATADNLRTLAQADDLPSELDYLRRHSIWPAFKSEFQSALERRLVP